MRKGGRRTGRRPSNGSCGHPNEEIENSAAKMTARSLPRLVTRPHNPLQANGFLWSLSPSTPARIRAKRQYRLVAGVRTDGHRVPVRSGDGEGDFQFDLQAAVGASGQPADVREAESRARAVLVERLLVRIGVRHYPR